MGGRVVTYVFVALLIGSCVFMAAYSIVPTVMKVFANASSVLSRKR